jgi:hypothetical protein
MLALTAGCLVLAGGHGGLGGNAAAASATAAGKCATEYSRGSSPTSGLVRQAHPVVLIHGWDGAAMGGTRTALEKKMTPGWQFLLYDYSSVHDHWASRPEVAGCLAQYLLQVSDAHRHAGGDGIVYLVAHSMGGLAASYAIDPAYGGIPGLADRIGGLTTIDTPWTGAPWGGTDYARLLQAIANRDLPGPDTDAWKCLRTLSPGGRGGCSVPRYLPGTIPVDQIAAEITVQRTFFGFHAYDIPLASDTVVPARSQHGYLGSASGSTFGHRTTLPDVPCTMTMNALIAEGGTRLSARGGPLAGILGGLTATEAQLLYDGRALDAVASGHASASLIEFLAAAFVLSPCAHTNMPKNPAAIGAIVSSLRTQAASRSYLDLHRLDWSNAAIPGGACGLPGTTQFRDGAATKPQSPNGPMNVELLGAVSYGDLDGDGHDDAGVSISCSSTGGNAVLGQGFVILTGRGRGLTEVGYVSAKQQQPGVFPSGVVSVDIRPGRITAQEIWYRLSDPHCCGSGQATTIWTYAGGALRPGRPHVTH